MAQLKSTLVQGNLTATGQIVANKIIKQGGTSRQILMADGSVSLPGDLQNDIDSGLHTLTLLVMEMPLLVLLLVMTREH